MRQLLRWTASAGLVCTLMGCGSLHLYDGAADKAATSAKTDYDASKITDSIKLSRAVLDALDAKEVEAFGSINLAERNATLLSLLSESGTAKKRTVDDGFMARFNKDVDKRLDLLIGDAKNARQVSLDMAAKTKTVDAAAGEESRARSALVKFDAAFALLPACNAKVGELKDSADLTQAAALLRNKDLKPKHDVQVPVWTINIKAVGEKCTKLMQAREALAEQKKKLNGQLGEAAKNTKTQSDTLNASQDASDEAATRLKSASKDLADAQKAADPAKVVVDLKCDLSASAAPGAGASAPESAASSPTGAADPAKKKSELCDVLAKLKGLDDFGIQAISEERLTKINDILAAVSGNVPTDKGKLEPGLALISTTSRFAQAWTQYQQVGKLPALEPLLIDKELTTAQLAYAKVGVQLAESRVRYAKAYEDATLLEIGLLTNAKAEIASLVIDTPPAAGASCDITKPTVFCASVSELLDDKRLGKDPTKKTDDTIGRETANRRVYRALALLSESYSVARARQLEAELRLIDSEYRAALSRSEASLASWDALLSVPVDQLRAYHAGGIKPAEAASLAAQVVQALAAVGIAVRIK